MKNKLINDLKKIGVKEGDELLVHASLRSVGDFSHRAEIITDALLDVIGKKGTLLMPALSFGTVTRKNPYFDVKTTTSCVGALSEYFRCREGVLRSLHPTHSVASYGREAHFYIRDHFKDSTPVGGNSPFFKLKERKGKILFIGCGLNPNTSMHGVEELIVPPYLFGKESLYFLSTADGETLKNVYKNHNFEGYAQRYDRIEELLTDPYLKRGKLLKADSYLLDAEKLWQTVYEKMLEEPLYFVDKIEEPVLSVNI